MASGRKQVKTEKKPCQGKCRDNNVIKPLDEFWHSRSFMHPDGRTTICKECSYEYLKDINDILVFLAHTNLPFLTKVWFEDAKEDIGKYIQRMQQKQNQSKTFKDSDKHAEIIPQITTQPNVVVGVTDEHRLFWRNFKDEDIKVLQHRYEKMTSRYECETPVQEILLKNIVTTQFRLEDTTDTDQIKKLTETLSKFMQDASIKPAQDKGNIEDSLQSYGLWIKKIEETEPIPEPLEEFKDPDNIGTYIKKWFVSHFAKLFGMEDGTSSNKGEANE